jgi:hypothetical protein
MVLSPTRPSHVLAASGDPNWETMALRGFHSGDQEEGEEEEEEDEEEEEEADAESSLAEECEVASVWNARKQADFPMPVGPKSTVTPARAFHSAFETRWLRSLNSAGILINGGGSGAGAAHGAAHDGGSRR